MINPESAVGYRLLELDDVPHRSPRRWPISTPDTAESAVNRDRRPITAEKLDRRGATAEPASLRATIVGAEQARRMTDAGGSRGGHATSRRPTTASDGDRRAAIVAEGARLPGDLAWIAAHDGQPEVRRDPRAVATSYTAGRMGGDRRTGCFCRHSGTCCRRRHWSSGDLRLRAGGIDSAIAAPGMVASTPPRRVCPHR